MKVLKNWYHGLVFLFVNLGPLEPKGHQREIFEVGHRAFYGVMGTFVEGCQNRKKERFFRKNEKTFPLPENSR